MAQAVSQTSYENRPSSTAVGELEPVQKPFVWLGVLISALLFITIVQVTTWTQGVLFVIGLAFGLALLYARFGFTSAFRRLISVGNVQGLQAHMLMLAVATTLFAIILATGFSFTGVAPQGMSFQPD